MTTSVQAHATDRLIGQRVTATSTGSSKRRLRGVLLPAVREGGRLRLHADSGGVVALNPAGWLIAPETGMAERRKDRRRTECPAGRPLYRHGDLPALQLATVTMLRRARRRVADGQQPIASYMTYRDYAPLYAVADAVAMPPLSPARQAAWDTARTCVTCVTRAATPYERGPDGERHCEPCQEPAAEAWWHAQRAKDRTAGTEWARGVLADPAAVLIYSANTVPSSCLRVETLDGEVLIEVDLRAEPIPDWWPAEDHARFTNPREVVDQIRTLACRRLISSQAELYSLNGLMRKVGADVQMDVDPGDTFCPVGCLDRGALPLRR